MTNTDAPQTITTDALETATGGRGHHHGHYHRHHGHYHRGWGGGWNSWATAALAARAFGGGWGQQPVVINYY